MASSPTHKRLFFLGATGYIGSQFLVSARRDPVLSAHLASYTLVALVRDIASAKCEELKRIWPGIEVVEGSMNDTAIVEDEAKKADVVVNCAVSVHEEGIRAILSGLEQRSTSNTPEHRRPPLYVHVTGLAIVMDNSRGEQLPEEEVGDQPKWASDKTFRLEDCPRENMHYTADSMVYNAGRTGKVKTILVYPGFVYGTGEGVSKHCTLYRIFAELYIKSGIVGTWGPGWNRWSLVHVKDVASAMVHILNASLGGTLDGENPFYFVCDHDSEPMVMNKVAKGIGKVLHAAGRIQNPEHQPFPDEVTASFGEGSWRIFGGNVQARAERLLEELGWVPVETRAMPLMDGLTSEVNLLLESLTATSSATADAHAHAMQNAEYAKA